MCFVINMAACIICLRVFSINEPFTTLTQKGCDGIIKAGALREIKIVPSVGDKVINTF